MQEGMSALNWASWCGKHECLVLLISAGADINARSKVGSRGVDSLSHFAELFLVSAWKLR